MIQGKPTNTASSAPQTGGGMVPEVSVVIDPTCTRRIEGTSDLNRSTYFNEQCADHLTEKGKDYASCKLVRLDLAAHQEVNKIVVSFPDGKPDAVGAVVIRAAYQVT